MTLNDETNIQKLKIQTLNKPLSYLLTDIGFESHVVLDHNFPTL